MRDRRFQKYHAKWQLDPDEDIDPAAYNCNAYVPQKTYTIDDTLNNARVHQQDNNNEEVNEENIDENGIENQELPAPAAPNMPQHKAAPEHQNMPPAENTPPIKQMKKPKVEQI